MLRSYSSLNVSTIQVDEYPLRVSILQPEVEECLPPLYRLMFWILKTPGVLSKLQDEVDDGVIPTSGLLRFI
jgi:hypothetical protein